MNGVFRKRPHKNARQENTNRSQNGCGCDGKPEHDQDNRTIHDNWRCWMDVREILKNRVFEQGYGLVLVRNEHGCHGSPMKIVRGQNYATTTSQRMLRQDSTMWLDVPTGSPLPSPLHPKTHGTVHVVAIVGKDFIALLDCSCGNHPDFVLFVVGYILCVGFALRPMVITGIAGHAG